MPLYRKKRVFKRKKLYRKKWSRKRVIRRNSNKVLVKVKYTTIINEATNLLSFNVSCTDCLNAVNNASTPNADFSRYLELYDLFRPCGVKVQIIPFYNVNAVVSSTNSIYSPMYSAIDYTDVNTSTLKTPTDLIEYNNVKFQNTYRPIKRYTKLKKYQMIAHNTSGSGPLGYVLTDGYTQATAQGKMPGVMYFATDNSNATNYDLKILITYYYAFKQRK